jgi:hypothetical protein
MQDDNASTIFGIIILILLVVGLIAGAMFILPQYGVWQQGMAGKAKLSEAEYSRQIKVLEAKAELDSEKLNAEAEVVRAGGVAKSNAIVRSSINEMYIRYLWVKTLDGAQKEIIYIPTEAGLPVTEAARLQPTK